MAKGPIFMSKEAYIFSHAAKEQTHLRAVYPEGGERAVDTRHNHAQGLSAKIKNKKTGC